MILFDRKIIFIHIPRTAGTSIKQYLRSISDNYSDNPWHLQLEKHEWKYGIKLKDFQIFTCVRNPYERIYSVYLYRKSKNFIDAVKRNFIEWVTDLKDGLIDGHFIWGTITQSEWIRGKNEVYLLNYNNLNKEFKFLLKHFNLPISKLDHLHCLNSRNYKDIYNERIKNIVFKMFEYDFKKFGFNKNIA